MNLVVFGSFMLLAQMFSFANNRLDCEKFLQHSDWRHPSLPLVFPSFSSEISSNSKVYRLNQWSVLAILLFKKKVDYESENA